jgi:transposase-like protein
MSKARKHYTVVEKVAILRRHLVERVPVSNICDPYGVRPSMFYDWQKLFFENGAAAFEHTPTVPEKEKEKERTITALREKLQRKNEVVVKLHGGARQVKKELGEL